MSKPASKGVVIEAIPLCHYRGALLVKAVARKAAVCKDCQQEIKPGDEVWRVLIENYGESGITRGARFHRHHFKGGLRYR